ncbi:MAG: hypothetical protein JWO86_6794 [Myxococcaceae bacterium]|nr:hypothetical protein [Myxococcaceae bacterium]
MNARAPVRSLVFAVALGSSLGAASVAHAAPETVACIKAFDDGQRLRGERHLLAARDRLFVCARTECPSEIRSDCANVLREVELATPSIVLGASDGDGHDVTDIHVDLDGRRIAEQLDGRAVSVDPGKLVLRFEREASGPPVTVEILVGEGEKNRAVRTVLGAKSAAPNVPREPPKLPLHEEKRSFIGWAAPIGFAVIGAGALTLAGITRLRLGDEVDGLQASCGTKCDPSERDRLHDDLAVANVSLAIGITSVVLSAASWLLFAPHTKAAAPPQSALAW